MTSTMTGSKAALRIEYDFTVAQQELAMLQQNIPEACRQMREVRVIAQDVRLGFLGLGEGAEICQRAERTALGDTRRALRLDRRRLRARNRRLRFLHAAPLAAQAMTWFYGRMRRLFDEIPERFRSGRK